MIIPLEPPRDYDSPFHAQGVDVPGGAGLVFVSGQVGVRPDGSVGEGVTEQTRISMENIAGVLGEADLALPAVASLRVYLTTSTHIAEFVAAATPYLGGHRPACTLLILELANPELLVQVEAIAVAASPSPS